MSRPEINVGARIQKARLAKGLTAEALARTLDVSTRTVTRWEAGDSTPSITTLELIADALDQPVGYFLEAEAAAA